MVVENLKYSFSKKIFDLDVDMKYGFKKRVFFCEYFFGILGIGILH